MTESEFLFDPHGNILRAATAMRNASFSIGMLCGSALTAIGAIAWHYLQ
jgi:hypothetical protein